MTYEEKQTIAFKRDTFCLTQFGECSNCILEDLCEKHAWINWNDPNSPPTIPDYDWGIMSRLIDTYTGDTLPLEETPVETVESDPVNHPNHYCVDGYECFDVMIAIYGKEVVQHFCLCNAFKYLWRHGRKNGDEDLAKARVYLEKYKELGGA